jgi:hypothetical protein
MFLQSAVCTSSGSSNGFLYDFIRWLNVTHRVNGKKIGEGN